MNQNIKLVEELRKRAKDNKAKNAEYFFSLSFESVKDLRTVLFTVPTLVFAYVQSGLGEVNNPYYFKILFFSSFISGVSSYIFFWKATINHANHYADRETVFAKVINSEDEYSSLIEIEEKLKTSYRNYWFFLSLIATVLQLLFVIFILLEL